MSINIRFVNDNYDNSVKFSNNSNDLTWACYLVVMMVDEMVYMMVAMMAALMALMMVAMMVDL